MKLRKDQPTPAGTVRVKKNLCVCGHPRSVHTPLIGCIAMVKDVPWRHCGCKLYKSSVVGSRVDPPHTSQAESSPAIARAQSSGNAAVRPETRRLVDRRGLR